ncbi:hypothetical protein P692DRAFT_20876141, partial [Suillus brevipes Sb2]
GLEDLLSIPDAVPGKSLINSDSATRPAQSKNTGRVPLGFFDGVQGNIHSSSRSVHDHSSSAHHPHYALAPSMGISRVLLRHLPSLFRRSHSPTSEATEFQQRSRTRISIFSRRGPPTHSIELEVAAIRDKQALYVAPRPEREKAKYMQQQQSQAQALLSQTQPTDASMPATPPATSSTTSGAANTRPPPIPFWARLVLFLCCASPPHADGH